MINQILEAENSEITRLITGTADVYTHAPEIALINSKQLPPKFFGKYMEEYFKRTSNNLCDNLEDKSSVSFDYDTCQLVEKGLFQYGVPKTIERINQVLMTINTLDEEFWFAKANGHDLPRILDIFYAQEMVIAINRQNEAHL